MGGTIDGIGIRGTILEDANGWCFSLGPAWLRDCTVRPGVEVEVMILPEGPQRSDLAPDIVVRSRRTRQPGRSSTRSSSSIATTTCGGSTPRNAGPTTSAGSSI